MSVPSVHHLVDEWAVRERERPGAGAAEVAALSETDARLLWDQFVLEEQAVTAAREHLDRYVRQLRRSSRMRASLDDSSPAPAHMRRRCCVGCSWSTRVPCRRRVRS